MSFIRVPVQCFQGVNCHVCSSAFDDENYPLAHLEQTDTELFLADPIHPKCLKNWMDTDIWMNCEPRCPICPMRITDVNGVPIHGANREPIDGVLPLQDGITQITTQQFIDHLLVQLAGVNAQEDEVDESTDELRHSNDNSVQEHVQEDPLMVMARGLEVLNAAQHGRMEQVRSLLANNAAIHEETRGTSVIKALELPHAGIAELLIENGPIPGNLRDSALILAARNWMPSTVRALLANGSISAEAKGKALISAAQIGCWEIVQDLLANRAGISEEHWGLAIIEASSNNRQQTLQLLLSRGPVAIEYRSVALVYASKHNHDVAARMLLADNVEIIGSEREKAVGFAVKNRNLPLTKLLLEKGPINPQFCGSLLCTAAQNGDLEIVKALLGGSPIEYIGTALIFAIEGSGNGHGRITQLLLGCQITDDYRSVAVKKAAEYGDTDLVKRLLQGGAIAVQYRDAAIEYANQYGDNEMIDMLKTCTTTDADILMLDI